MIEKPITPAETTSKPQKLWKVMKIFIKEDVLKNPEKSNIQEQYLSIYRTAAAYAVMPFQFSNQMFDEGSYLIPTNICKTEEDVKSLQLNMGTIFEILKKFSVQERITVLTDLHDPEKVKELFDNTQ